MKLKKLATMLLAMLLVLTFLTSCMGIGVYPPRVTTGEDDEGTSGTTATTQNDPPARPPKEQVDTLNIFNNGVSGYRIVYPIGKTAWEYNMAYNLQGAIERITGVKLPVVNDFEFEDEAHTMRQEKEILIGETSRSDEYSIPSNALDINLGYAMFVSYERLVILGNSQVGMYAALRQIILDWFDYDLDLYSKDYNNLPAHSTDERLTVTVRSSYFRKQTVKSDYFAELNVMLDDVVIKHNKSALQERVAYEIQKAIYGATGKELTVTGNTVADGTPTIVFRTDLTLKKGTWSVTSDGDKTITVAANGYYGFYDSANFFKDAIDAYGYYSFEVVHTGDYLDHVRGNKEATKYAYDQKGDLRVMFLNVLFGSVEPTARNSLQGYLINEYRPDVLGCQEFNYTKRGEWDHKEKEGKGGLVEILMELGYEEAIDPRVRNAYPFNKVIPGTEGYGHLTQPEDYIGPNDSIKGYGPGGTSVTVNGETFNTFYNNAPLFYNTATTEKLDAGYHWYKNQWNRIEVGEDGKYIHDNSPMDCGSKAATWGVFRDKETGEKYIVISTHMCTRSDYVRGLQGQEIVDLINDLVAEHDCPVFFGGDMNGNIGDSNYDLFIREGFLSMQDTLIGGKHIATDFTSDLRTNAAYPDLDSNHIMKPVGSDPHPVVQEEDKNSIDQIFMINGEDDVEVGVFAVVVDDIARSSSDHMPIFIDFSFK